MPEGDVAQITTAIQNALRPASVNGPRAPKVSVQMIGPSEQVEEDVIDASAETDDSDLDNAPAKPASSRSRRPAKRKVVDIDLDSDVSLASYAEKHQPKNDQDRYLVSVAFLCEHRRDVEAIAADHVYTCFRKLHWPTGSKDFAQPLRSLKKNQYLDQGPSRGTYVVNHLGLDKVHKLAEE